jgi:hypothetical protein
VNSAVYLYDSYHNMSHLTESGLKEAVPLFEADAREFCEIPGRAAATILGNGLNPYDKPTPPVLINPNTLAAIGDIAKLQVVYVLGTEQQFFADEDPNYEPGEREIGVAFTVDESVASGAFYISAVQLLRMAREVAKRRTSTENPRTELDHRIWSMLLAQGFDYSFFTNPSIKLSKKELIKAYGLLGSDKIFPQRY